ncbi:UBX domain-containing protein 10 [Lingula anatina]|uniref:UBX domain-containing protein 10 n=1 Tax=Lingula anatina TaxID=7574 RepID=A0A1S3JLY0_LINAN|nr:UBX domain-containing protein 10 [Lingula anatina]|eukprot:XP_013410919.1 UBX domain-containing protein 10 [Lingula anatina]
MAEESEQFGRHSARIRHGPRPIAPTGHEVKRKISVDSIENIGKTSPFSTVSEYARVRSGSLDETGASTRPKSRRGRPEVTSNSDVLEQAGFTRASSSLSDSHSNYRPNSQGEDIGLTPSPPPHPPTSASRRKPRPTSAKYRVRRQSASEQHESQPDAMLSASPQQKASQMVPHPPYNIDGHYEDRLMSPGLPGTHGRPPSANLNRYSPLPGIGQKLSHQAPDNVTQSMTLINLNSNSNLMKQTENSNSQRSLYRPGSRENQELISSTSKQSWYSHSNNQPTDGGTENRVPQDTPCHTPELSDTAAYDSESPRKLEREILLPPEPGEGEECITLAVKLLSGRRAMRNFHPEDMLQSVLNFAEVQDGLDLSGYMLVSNSVPPQKFPDLSRTIAESHLENRTALLLHRGDQ